MHALRLALAFCCLTALLCGQAACRRSDPATDLTTSAKPNPNKVIDDILEKYISALGGQTAVEQVKSFAGKGTLSMSILRETGTFEVWGKDPDKSLTVIRFPRGIVIRKGFDGETRWVQVPGVISSEEGPNEMAEVERDADVYGAGRIKKLYESMRLEGKARLNKRDVEVVEGKPAKGPTDKLFFDSESGLLLRWDMVRRHPKRGNVFVKVHLDNYQEVDGVKIPFNVRFAFESFQLTLKLDELTHNVALDDAIFRKPKG